MLLLLLIFPFFLSQVYDVVEMEKTKNGIKGKLQWRANSTRKTKFTPPGIILNLNFQFFFETEERCRLKITDAEKSRWEVPFVVISKTPEVSPENLKYDVKINEKPFYFSVVRKSDGYVMFNTESFDFYYADQYIEVNTNLVKGDTHIYGLGERVHNFRLDPKGKTYVIFNKDQGTPVDKNLYGSHPFYLQLLNNGKSHGVFFLNSNAQDFRLDEDNGNLKWRTIGGIVDTYFFVGDEPKQVVKQYLKVIGNPMLPNYWGLGYHQCRWGYKSLDDNREVVKKFKEHGIPLETFWNDIDYMDGYRDFTTDPKNFAKEDYRKFVDELHANDQHYIHIIDPGIKNETGYYPYEYGLKEDCFIKKSDGKTNLVNKVWPGYTVFPDFSNSKGVEYWKTLVKTELDELNYDGIWIDMNEVAGFCDGECVSPPYIKEKKNFSSNFDPIHPPYVPGGEDLKLHTNRMDALQSIGMEYNAHSLYGFEEGIATAEALKEKYNKRAFVISRSTFAGSGRYVGHWLGDNYASFNDLFYSISGCLSMSIFGISTCGPDICGFGGDTNEELCTRWMEAASLFTFMRNHNTKGARSQEPYAFGDTLINASKKSLAIRYSLLPYMYSMLFLAHRDGKLKYLELTFVGETVMRPIFFEFPSDSSGLLPYLDRQFLVGPGLMISPVVFSGDRDVSIYVPDEMWYDFYTGKLLDCKRKETCKLPAPIDYINIHVRGGYVIPRKKPEYTTAATRKNPFELIVALDEKGNAEGYLYFDDGVSIDPLKNNQYTTVVFKASKEDNQKIRATPEKTYFDGTNYHLDKVTVFGVNQPVQKVVVQGKTTTNYKYDKENHVLEIFGVAESLLQKIEISYQ